MHYVTLTDSVLIKLLGTAEVPRSLQLAKVEEVSLGFELIRFWCDTNLSSFSWSSSSFVNRTFAFKTVGDAFHCWLTWGDTGELDTNLIFLLSQSTIPDVLLWLREQDSSKFKIFTPFDSQSAIYISDIELATHFKLAYVDNMPSL
ncbi:MAG: hypothetical protein HC836_23245 [Richelia sp. RM2_1_2]|nr:hypothetical protein [Richelia sp. RM2_1_2]